MEAAFAEVVVDIVVGYKVVLELAANVLLERPPLELDIPELVVVNIVVLEALVASKIVEEIVVWPANVLELVSIWEVAVELLRGLIVAELDVAEETNAVVLPEELWL